ncbi:MAG: hydroxymethylglutaryl-CoA lyase [Dehalococcoidia bacterium]|nr:hydroxymethylglutaryl-CoA lyase [Dehalococcoidia bacterium]
MRLPERVLITEVGPRDGLQNEARTIPTHQKVALIERLADTGLKRIEAVSFVHPRAVPQMADAPQVMAALRRRPGVTYIALVPNEVGARNAIAAQADELAVVVSASESHNRANLNRSIAETLAEIGRVARLAREASIPWAGYVSTAFGCPYEGAVDPERVVSLARELRDLGAYAVALGDTIGVANPRQVYELVSRLRQELPGFPVRLHLHDTRGAALANVLAAMEAGADQFDGSVGGLGGCPYAPGASGNVATEDLVAMLEAMGVGTGVDLAALVEVSWFAEEVVGRPLEGRVRKAMGRRGQGL